MTNTKIGIIGLSYVGLPLAVESAKNQPLALRMGGERAKELAAGYDRTRELEREQIFGADYLKFADSVEDLKTCNVYIVTVPNPINLHKQPDLNPLISASKM